MSAWTVEPAFCVPDESGHCAVCADEGLVGRVLAVNSARSTALVEIGGEQREVAVELVEPVAPGELLLVHLGVALTRVEAALEGEVRAGDEDLP